MPMPLRPNAIVSPVHVLPEILDIEWVGADQQRLQVEIDGLFRHARRQRGIADADVTRVGEDLDDQPAMEPEAAHGVVAEVSDRSIGLVQKCGWGGTVCALPFHNASADFSNLHTLRSF